MLSEFGAALIKGNQVHSSAAINLAPDSPCTPFFVASMSSVGCSPLVKLVTSAPLHHISSKRNGVMQPVSISHFCHVESPPQIAIALVWKIWVLGQLCAPMGCGDCLPPAESCAKHNMSS